MGIREHTGGTGQPDDKVRELPDKYAAQKQEVAEALRYLLGLAERGEIVELEAVARMTNGCTLEQSAGDKGDVFRMAGMLFDHALSYREDHIAH